MTGVQTCALPISVAIKTQIQLTQPQDKYRISVVSAGLLSDNRVDIWVEEKQVFTNEEGGRGFNIVVVRSEERRVGKECRSRWSPYH